eukprot:CAMPEP_0196598052 /NCGR_PEP_ID=MMETSP1081-20130531/94092_1 /TAXON_ID=36882 /ORGANISM="Pyramimonas amylifera, Strain CCMP720" /LENGTH=151 /DNA_ID=CAMNT_0041923681 /DNA_START=844 /DNA_END=1299 /DNA_ORIENTATION=+
MGSLYLPPAAAAAAVAKAQASLMAVNKLESEASDNLEAAKHALHEAAEAADVATMAEELARKEMSETQEDQAAAEACSLLIYSMLAMNRHRQDAVRQQLTEATARFKDRSAESTALARSLQVAEDAVVEAQEAHNEAHAKSMPKASPNALL